jgi:pimeloyl-ACP methyl ester carboxylesterase
MLTATVVLAAAMSALGLSDIAVVPSRSGDAGAPWQRTLAALDEPTERTADTLRRYDLFDRYRRDPGGALLRLENQARLTPEPELVYALAELSWVEARRLDRRRKPAALDHYLDAVTYAYDFLFDPDLAAGREPTDPRFRAAIDLYNGGLDQILRAVKAKGPIEPGGTILLKVHDRELRLRVNLESSPWKAEDIHELLLASDYEVTGLPTRSYQYGLGTPLIGIRKAAPAAEGPAPSGPERFLPAEMAFPLTAFLHPDSRLRAAPAEANTSRDCTLDLIDPVAIRSVKFRLGQQDYALGIEADFTKPLATMWSRTDVGKVRWAGFLRPSAALERSGLTLLRPYEPDKIPVVMVHGLMSSPLAWIPMINELLRDPAIQKRYQFLLYMYPTGVPVPIAASYLRDALIDARRQFDPQGTSPTFRRMVLLGHSMGGLLSHAVSVDSGNCFWEINSERAFDQIVGPPEVLNELRHYTFFEALPFVERVVFLATPHRGSELARRTIGRVGSSLIAEPDHYSGLLSRLVKDNDGDLDPRQFRRLPTSIETLEVDSDVLLALLRMRPRPGVTYHSIIGANRPGPAAKTTDGVVPYRSSHLEGVASERVVRSDHSVQKDPEAILEVRRILLEHLGAATAAALAGTPAAAPMPTAPPVAPEAAVGSLPALTPPVAR